MITSNPIRMTRRCLLLLMAFCLVGCGSASVTDSIAQTIADPTGQLPAHVDWNSYNLYQYQPGASGKWVQFVSLGIVTGNVPTLGDKPVMMIHGLGGSIKDNEFVPMAQNLFDNNLAPACSVLSMTARTPWPPTPTSTPRPCSW